jgi:hypothetical protein
LIEVGLKPEAALSSAKRPTRAVETMGNITMSGKDQKKRNGREAHLGGYSI